jgi:hypothetical protein
VDGDRWHITATRPDGKEWGKFEGRVKGDAIDGTRREKDSAARPKSHVFD